MEEVGNAGVPARVELEPTVQGSDDVRVGVTGGLVVLLVQHGGLEGVLHLQVRPLLLSLAALECEGGGEGSADYFITDEHHVHLLQLW